MQYWESIYKMGKNEGKGPQNICEVGQWLEEDRMNRRGS